MLDIMDTLRAQYGAKGSSVATCTITTTSSTRYTVQMGAWRTWYTRQASSKSNTPGDVRDACFEARIAILNGQPRLLIRGADGGFTTSPVREVKFS
jgi:hypothetical protein